MKNEIDKDFYCSTAGMADCSDRGDCKIGSVCPDCHRKWPTPEQFEEEYGEKYPNDGAVYFRHRLKWDEKTKSYIWTEWRIDTYAYYLSVKAQYVKEVWDKFVVVCACTPFGKPDKEWRPQY